MTNRKSNWRVSHKKTFEYDVVNCTNVFGLQNDGLLSVGKRKNTRRLVIVDENIHAQFSKAIRDYFDFHNVETKILPLSSGEKNKTLDNYLWILTELDRFPINRRDEPIIVIGGGVLTDIAGFVASSYRRGIPHIKVPTTLMGYVDASVGIKTGINFNNNKNRLGSFEPPKLVLLDRGFLKTLSERHILNGLCEIIKLAVIKDLTLFELLEVHGVSSIQSKFQDEISASILDRAVGGMLEELEPNLFEDELSRRVDFGHTFSYGFEAYHDSKLLHGEAVLIDILLSSILARTRSLLSEPELDRLFNLVSNFGINPDISLLNPDLLWDTLEERTYHRNGLQRVPLPEGLGECTYVNDIGFDEIKTACKILLERRTNNEPIYQYG